MKHSAPIKFPTKYLISVVIVCFLITLATGWFIYSNYKKAARPADGKSDKQVVTQFKESSYQQAINMLK